MMRSFWLVSVFAILVVCGQVSISRPAYGGCCFLPGCSGACTRCSGSCPYCCGYGRSPQIFQATFITGNAMWERIVLEDPLPVTVSDLDITEHFAKMTRGGECTRRKFTLRIIGNAEQLLLATSARFTEPGIAERALAFNIEPQNRE